MLYSSGVQVSTVKALEHRDVQQDLRVLEGALKLPGPLRDIQQVQQH
jgi:hypothetical protein